MIIPDQIEQFVKACHDNWVLAARALIAIWRVLLAARYNGISSSGQSSLVRADFEAGYANHRERLERSGISREHLHAALQCIVDVSQSDAFPMNHFYVVQGPEGEILCRTYKSARGRTRDLTIPSVTDILSVLIRPYCGPAFTQNILAHDVREHYQILDTKEDVGFEILHLCEVFNAFADQQSKSFAYEDLLACLEACSESRKEMAHAFLEWLLVRNVVTQGFFDRKALYRRRGKADASFLTNTLLGLYTGIAGLDYLFEGALRTHRLSPISILIKGPAGTGKSSLAMTCAAAWASAGALVWYATIEQDIGKLISVLKDWHLFCDRAFQVFTTDVYRENIEACLSKSRGVFLGGSPGYGLSFDDMRSKLDHYITSPLMSRFASRLLVLDSVNALRAIPDPQLWRETLNSFVEMARTFGYSVVFVLEDDTNSHKVDSFIVDTVVRLSYADYGGQRDQLSQYQYRVIAIEKARQQHTCRGEHLFRVRAGQGIRVYPSTSAMLATIKKPDRMDAPARMWRMPRFLVEGFDKLSASVEGWLREGTCTAIVGEEGTKKSALARAFSKSVVYDDGDDDNKRITSGFASLLILFGQRFDKAKDEVVSELRITEHCRCYEVMPSGRCEDMSRELVLEFPSGYQTGSNVISEVVESIEYLRSQQCSLRCAILDDLDGMEAEHPVLVDDEFFLPCLVQLLESNGASIFLVNRRPKGTFEEHDRKIESLSQNVIRLVKVHEPGRDRVAIFVSKSSSGLHSKDDLELQMRSDGGLAIQDSFRPYRDVRMGGMLQPIKITFIVPAETHLQQEYYQEIQKLQKAININVTVHWAKPGPGLLQRALSPERVSTSGEVVVVACDNADLPALVDSGYFEDLSEFLSDDAVSACYGKDEARKISKEVARQRLFTAQGPFLDSITMHLPAAREEKDYARYQLPYYLNPSVLVAQRFFHDRVMSTYSRSYTWEDLATTAEQLVADTDRPMRLFECTGISLQTYACFFMEVFFSLVEQLPAYKGGCICFCDCLDQNMTLAQEALALVYRLASLQSGNKAYQSEFRANPQMSYPCVFRRQWYSTFREHGVRQMQTTKECDLAVMPLPKYRSILGDWHLCVLHGSVSPQIGVEFIAQLCSDPMTIERMARGVGLTPKKKFYESGFSAVALPISQLSMEEFRKIHAHSIARSHIGCYRTLSQLMGACIISLLHEPARNITAGRINEFLRSLRGLFVPSTCPAHHLSALTAP